MTPTAMRFPLALRLLHWLMAACILVMLFIGVGMVSTVSELRTWLIDLHKPLGILILCLAAIRACIRLTRPAPADLPTIQRLAAHLSHLMLYALMFALPLVGWTMLSAGGYPVELFGTLVLPPLAPIDGPLFAFLRQAHTVLAMTLFATILVHLGAALFHAWVRRDGVWHTMTLAGRQRRPPTSSIGAGRSAGSS